jgi:predicted negative regulator of RcsB-dependent stress response
MAIQQPPHPMPALTTYELRNYRRELEHSLKTLPEHAQIRALLQQRLAEVLAEQDSRDRLHHASGTGTTSGRAGE